MRQAFLLPQLSLWCFSSVCQLDGFASVFSAISQMMLYGKTPVMTKYLRRELCMPAFCAFLVFSSCFVGQAAGQDGPPLDWKSQYGVKVATSQEGDCSTKVKNGDIVYIRHRGIYADENEKMVQFDGDGGEPLRFVVGEKRIITGMEVGVIGQVYLKFCSFPLSLSLAHSLFPAVWFSLPLSALIKELCRHDIKRAVA
jgi:hypothetical protein